MFSRNNRQKRRFPAVILQFIDTSGHGYHQYIPFATTEVASQSLQEFFKNGGNHQHINVFVDPKFDTEYAEEMQNIIRESCGHRLRIYRINQTVFQRAF